MLDFRKELGSVASRQDPFWTKYYEAVARHGTMLSQWEKAVVDTVNLDAAYPSPTDEQKVAIVRPFVRVMDLYHHNVPLVISLYKEFKVVVDIGSKKSNEEKENLKDFLTNLNAMRTQAANDNGVLFIGPDVDGWAQFPTLNSFIMGVAKGVRDSTPTKQLAYRYLNHVPLDSISGSPNTRVQVAVGMNCPVRPGIMAATDTANTSTHTTILKWIEGYQVLTWLAEYVRGADAAYPMIDPETLTFSDSIANPVLPMARDWYHILRFMRETVNTYAGLSFKYVTDDEYEFLESLPDVL